jgi:protein TonB
MRPVQPFRSTLLSLSLHAVTIAALVLIARLHGPVLAPRHMAGTAQGTEIMVSLQLPGAPPAAVAAPPTPRTHGPAAPTTAREPHKKAAQLDSPATPSLDGNAAEGALGDGDISIALVQFHPRPEPSLSTLAPGAAGDVVLDALIDEQGRVAHLSVTRSLGPVVDAQVIATVQHWTFTPAMRNGTPIASEQELLFHYERHSNG